MNSSAKGVKGEEYVSQKEYNQEFHRKSSTGKLAGTGASHWHDNISKFLLHLLKKIWLLEQ